MPIVNVIIRGTKEDQVIRSGMLSEEDAEEQLQTISNWQKASGIIRLPWISVNSRDVIAGYKSER